jgi:NlpC/P60 family/Bacterial dipeptidyl-peptidase Sh3 domain
MLREAPSHSARAASQLLRGEAFAMIDIAGGWAWGYGLHDRYVGYLPVEALGPDAPASHIVNVAQALLFAAPDIKSRIIESWPIGARFAAVEEGDFLATEQGYVHRRHARAIAQIGAETGADPVAVAEMLIGAPYRWGGRGGDGIDCSGLVQIALGLAGIVAPRDSDQQRALGDEIAPGAALRRGDLIFFPGHVGLMTDGEHMVHANAHWMAVTVEPLAEVVARLAPSYPEPIMARRRIG